MDISHLQRNPGKVHEALKEVGETLIAVKSCKIYIPTSFMTSGLGSIEETIKIAGIYAITVDDTYLGVSTANALMETEPSAMNTVTINNVPYHEFIYNPGDKVIANLMLVKTATLVYRIYTEIISKGKVPWYLSYTDLSLLFMTALSHGGANLKADQALMELMVGSIARQREDKTKFFRHDPRLHDPKSKITPFYVALKSVAYGATNTTAKLLGNYFSEGLTSALVTPSDRTEDIEDHLRL